MEIEESVETISIILPNLEGGGAERVAVNLANTWRGWGYKVDLVLMEAQGALIQALDPSIRVYDLKCKRIREVPIALRRYLLDHKPGISLVNMWPLTSAALFGWRLAGRPGKIFVCDHIGLTEHVRRDLGLPVTLVRALLRLTYPRATGVIAVSLGVAMDIAQLAGLASHYVRVIYNPVVGAELPNLLSRSYEGCKMSLWSGRFRTHLLSVGSLKSQKNHRLLLRAFARVSNELDAGLVILGEGTLRAELERDIDNLGLRGRVAMPGFFADPTPWYLAADLFVLSSDFEGFANVVAEALACGTPAVSTDCPHGPAEILDCGRYGELVPVGSAEALADGISRALVRQWDRGALQRRALDFSIPRQAEVYLNVFYA